MTNRKTREIRMYSGSLEELNSKDPKRQYALHGDPFTVFSFISSYGISVGSVRKAMRKDWDGLVYAVTSEKNMGSGFSCRVEGTPIVRIR